jgi:hypothetical protein
MLNRSIMATIVWYQNGIEKSRGIGKKTFSFTAGGSGSETAIRVLVQSIQGLSTNAEITIHPVTLDLLWEAQTTTPPLYQGKALLGSESLVRVVALPRFIYNGSVLALSDLYYEWRVGSRTLANNSGKGRNTLLMTAPKMFGKVDVTVSVTSTLHSFSAQKTLTLESVPTEVHLYSISPERGFNLGEALGGQINTSNDLTIQAVPYYFSKNKSPSFTWAQNGVFIKNPSSRVSFSRGESSPGPSSISVSVTNKDSLLQFAKTNLVITTQ